MEMRQRFTSHLGMLIEIRPSHQGVPRFKVRAFLTVTSFRVGVTLLQAQRDLVRIPQ